MDVWACLDEAKQSKGVYSDLRFSEGSFSDTLMAQAKLASTELQRLAGA